MGIGIDLHRRQELQPLHLVHVADHIGFEVEHLQLVERGERVELLDVVEGEVKLLQLGQRRHPIELRQPASAQPEHAQVAERGAELADRRQTAAIELELLEPRQTLPQRVERHARGINCHLQKINRVELVRAG